MAPRTRVAEPAPHPLVRGWDKIEHVHFYSLLGLSTHTNVKCYPTMTKASGLIGLFKGFTRRLSLQYRAIMIRTSIWVSVREYFRDYSGPL